MPPKTEQGTLADISFRVGDGEWQHWDTDVKPIENQQVFSGEFRHIDYGPSTLQIQVEADMLKFTSASARREWLRGKAPNKTAIRCKHNRHNKRQRIQKKWDKKYGAMYYIIFDGPFDVSQGSDGTLAYTQQSGEFGVSFNVKEDDVC